jgi:hypothetical protein
VELLLGVFKKDKRARWQASRGGRRSCGEEVVRTGGTNRRSFSNVDKFGWVKMG